MVLPVAHKRLRPCPVCKKLSHATFHPFCSSRCADEDLNRWLGGTYAIPAVEDDDQQDLGLPET